MKLRFTSQATRDLGSIADYLHEHNPAASLRVRAAILNTLQSVLLFPEVGRRQDIEGVRKVPTPKYPYLIFYYVTDKAADEVVVVAIQHAARERPYSDI